MNILEETNKILEAKSVNTLGIYLLWFVQKALPEKAITIYEAFQLMEISTRYTDRPLTGILGATELILSNI